MFARIITATLLACTALAAQNCPDRVVRHITGRTHIGSITRCSDASAVWRPAGTTINLYGCPSVVVVYPDHDTPVSQPGSGTYVELANRYAVMQYVFSCETDYFLFIPLITNCRLVEKRRVAYCNDYIERLCPSTIEAMTAVTGS